MKKIPKKIPKELRPNPKIDYLVPKMRFNPGTLKYEPVLKNKISNKKLSRTTKLSVWILGIILFLIIIFLLILLL